MFFQPEGKSAGLPLISVPNGSEKPNFCFCFCEQKLREEVWRRNDRRFYLDIWDWRNYSSLFYLKEVQDKTFLLLKRKNIPGSSCDYNIYRESCQCIKELSFPRCCGAVTLTNFSPTCSSEHLTLKADTHQGKPPCLCCLAGKALQSEFHFVTK